jgi:hypothetical protein
MKGILDFLKSTVFLKNLGIALVSLLIIFWLIFKGLDVYTHHGQTVSVPDFQGLRIKALDGFIKGKPLKYLVIDSIYDTKKEKGKSRRQDQA